MTPPRRPRAEHLPGLGILPITLLLIVNLGLTATGRALLSPPLLTALTFVLGILAGVQLTLLLLASWERRGIRPPWKDHPDD